MDFYRIFASADRRGIDLMNKMLVFLPRKRISCEKALEHPFLSELHDPEDEDTSDVKTFDCGYEKRLRSLAEVKKAIYDEA
eukprot:gene5974-2469_t